MSASVWICAADLIHQGKKTLKRGQQLATKNEVMGLLQLLGMSPKKDSAPAEQKRASAPRVVQERRLCRDPKADKAIRTGRYCNVLHAAVEHRSDSIAAAAKVLDEQMVFVPAGAVQVQNMIAGRSLGEEDRTLLWQDSFFIDKQLVTNAQFKHFLNDDGYRTPSLWPDGLQPFMPHFIDTTGVPAPAEWVSGNFDPEKADHPVTGISWYEANAYAKWAGKTLPSTTQWQRAGTWWSPTSIFPWGGGYDRTRMNTFAAGIGETVPVQDYAESSTPHGVQQLVGNVWEWSATYHTTIEYAGHTHELEEPIGELRGGAFDTYLGSQATCVFRSGQSLLSRTNNAGLRCAASHDLLAVIAGY